MVFENILCESDSFSDPYTNLNYFSGKRVIYNVYFSQLIIKSISI